MPVGLRSGLEDLKVTLQILVHLHDRGNIPTAIAVVGSRPDRHQLIVEHPLVSLHHQLVRSADEVEVILRIELHINKHNHIYLADRIAAEEIATAARAHTPSCHVFLGI